MKHQLGLQKGVCCSLDKVYKDDVAESDARSSEGGTNGKVTTYTSSQNHYSDSTDSC